MEFKGTKGKWDFKQLDEILSVFEEEKDPDKHQFVVFGQQVMKIKPTLN